MGISSFIVHSSSVAGGRNSMLKEAVDIEVHPLYL